MSGGATDVIRLEHVGLKYRLAKQRIPSLKEYAVHLVRGTLTYEELWALRDVSLAIGRGESVGVIGRNGAGKSTLLKVISGVLAPARGKVTVRGTVQPLLELGMGFDYELTGLENIYLNALLLGRTRAEARKAEPAIIETSGLGEFVHTPIRNYSTGMLARLGFAIATAWVPDVLILDEVLAVGDAEFQQRCHTRLQSFRDQGTTVLLVSHDPGAIVANCTRCVWLEAGVVQGDGPAADVLRQYQDFTYQREHGGASGEVAHLAPGG